MKNSRLFPILLLAALSSCSKSTDYDATGIFEATTVTVAAETAGKIMALNVNEGDSVTFNQPIATIDTTTFTLQISQLQSQLMSALNSSPDVQAQVAALRTQISHSKQELDRQKRLLNSGSTTQKAVDDAQAQLLTLQSQLTAQLSSLNKNRSSISDNAEAINYQIDQIREQIAKSRILSPISATVLEKYAEPGEYAIPGKPLVKLANLNDIYLRSYLTANQLADLKIGQEVTVIADFGGDEQFEYPGKITWIAQESEFTPKSIQTKDSRANLVYAVKIAVKNDGRLKLGQYGEVIVN
ncbi:MAG: HlyD family efflux transporter periplasmic adaptor subunit [Bacteroides sp.]|nr:HlyD family efflux transporter periplasmic adaptor subunit [Bacteroides sp.]